MQSSRLNGALLLCLEWLLGLAAELEQGLQRSSRTECLGVLCNDETIAWK